MTRVAAHMCLGKNRLDRKAQVGRPLLACYFPMGDPLFEGDMRDIYAGEGVDIVELGMPTPHPHLDGPDIAGAMARALTSPVDSYMRLAEMAEWLSLDSARPAGVCMAYQDLDMMRIAPATLDVMDGLLLIGRAARRDAAMIEALCEVHDVRECGLVPLGFSAAEAGAATAYDGYVMMQAASGPTGPRLALDAGLGTAIAGLRQAGITRPILAGFGIGTPEQAREAIDSGADGVVIGSMCMRKAMAGRAAIRGFLRDVRAALDA
ncbi:tryptophan synthase subunit alpha [Flavisphingomonas formosensis]|uniref:tryptophan synthase subunit alpha n=1 Tax=Flavisphingomonas formosensis TaxID=861534 RepID=UPI0012F86015|nr:tryptophan synthase subunit alpha [Sphingomonas formosensis]